MTVVTPCSDRKIDVPVGEDRRGRIGAAEPLLPEDSRPVWRSTQVAIPPSLTK